MVEPPLKQFPAEIFGYPYTDLSEKAQLDRSDQHCPFLDSECKKPRKSEPHIKIGVCSVGFKGNRNPNYVPVIVCPHRFERAIIQNTINTAYFQNLSADETTYWVSEVSMGQTTGSVDYVAVRVKTQENMRFVEDFICVEFQAAGTTGTPWQAILDFRESGQFKQDSYKYGINWANEFAKTMMQQAYKKGLVIEAWGKKIVFVIQDIAMAYLGNAYDITGLRENDQSGSVHFHTFKMVWNETSNRWEQRPDKHFSTDTEGIRKILGGLAKDDFPTQEYFISNILKKLS